MSSRQTPDAAAAASLHDFLGRTSADVVVGATAIANPSAIGRLLTHPLVSSVRDSKSRPKSSTSKKVPGLAALGTSHRPVPRDRWLPDQVQVWIEPSAQGGRYVQQQFTWYAGRALGFADSTQGSGYEADFWLDFSDGQSYLNPNELCCAGIPDVTAWMSDMPYETYLDTRFGDAESENAYTIGTVNAPNFTTGRWYYTYIRTTNGNASFDSGRIEPQYTEENVGGCNNTWCMFVHDRCEANITGTLWSVPVPRTPGNPVNWYRSWGCLNP